MFLKITIISLTALTYCEVIGETRVRRFSPNADQTNLFEVPYHVRIHKDGEFQCNGVFIDSYHVVTVARCISEFVDDLRKLKYRPCKVSRLRILVDSPTWNAGKRLKPQRIAYYKEFEVCNLLDCSYHNDIAVIKLEESHQTFTKSSPILIADATRGIHTYNNIEISGYSSNTRQDRYRLVFRASRFDIMSSDLCNEAMSTSKTEASNFCVTPRYPDIRLTEDDIGAPVTALRDGNRELVGIVTAASHLNFTDGVYVIINVPYFHKFIEYERNYMVGKTQSAGEMIQSIGVDLYNDGPIFKRENLNLGEGTSGYQNTHLSKKLKRN